MIRKITSGGVVTTVLGVVGSQLTEFRTGPDPRLANPLFMVMLDRTHIALSFQGERAAVYIATVP